MLCYAKVTSRHVALNGETLAVDNAGQLPPLEPVVGGGAPLVVPSLAFAFAVFPDVNAPAC